MGKPKGTPGPKTPRKKPIRPGRPANAKNATPIEKMEAIILLHDKYGGDFTKCSQDLDIGYETLRAWNKNYNLIEKSATAIHMMKYDLRELNKRKLDYHNGELIEEVSTMELELVNKMRSMINTIQKPSDLKYLTDMWKALTDRMVSIAGKTEVNIDASTTNNQQNNFHLKSVEDVKKATSIINQSE